MAVIAETPRKIDLDCTISKQTISNCTILKSSIVNDRSMKLAGFYHDRFRIVQGSVSSNQIQSRSRSDQLNNEIFKRATVISQKLTEELWEQDFKLILLKRTYSSFNFTILYHKSRMI